MVDEITVACADCGNPVDAVITDDKMIEAGCYTNVITVDDDDVTNDSIIVEQFVDMELPDDKTAVVYTECESCCPECSTEGPW